MPVQDALQDRVRALASLSAEQLAQVLELQPHLAAWAQGAGPLRKLLGPSKVTPDRRRLATALAHPETINLTLSMLPVAALQLVIIAVGRLGSLTAAQIDRELEPLAPDDREHLVRLLVDRMLAEPVDGGLRLRPGVADIVGLPGRSVQRLLLDQSVTTDVIALWLHNLGVRPVPKSKSDRIDALSAAFADRPRLMQLLDGLSTSSREMFARLMSVGGTGTSTGSLGVDIWQLRMRSMVLPRHLQSRADSGATGALRALSELGLVWVEESTYRVGLWLDVISTVQGRMYPHWPPLAAVEHRPLTADPSTAPAALGSLHSLLRQVASEPITGLKTGGVGVKAVRDLAKRLGMEEATVSLLLELAFGADLLVSTSEVVGRGRAATWVNRFEAAPDAVAAWTELSVPDQWRRLVAIWLEGLDLSPEDRLMVPALRRQLVADLLAVPAGHGIAADDIGVLIDQLHLAFEGNGDRHVHELAALGLVHPDGPVGLTSIARVLLTDPASLDEQLGAQVDTFVVQADLTVIAPPGLDPTVRARLDRLCTIESSGSVTVLRLDRARIAADLADGDQAEDLIRFLQTHSSVPVASVVTQTIHDVERQRGGLTASTTSTVVTADDVLGLAAAVKVKAARLTLIAPTVAVSDLPLAKVMAALRAKGLAPATGTVGDPGPIGDRRRRTAPTTRHVAPRPNGRARAAAELTALHPTRAQLERLVETW